MVNCGAGQNELPSAGSSVSSSDGSFTDGAWELNATIKALCKAFPGQVGCFFLESPFFFFYVYVEKEFILLKILFQIFPFLILSFFLKK